MDVYTAIETRRNIKLFRPDPVDRTVIERIVDAGRWAPNHRLTEPWFFTVLTGKAKEQFAELRRQIVMNKYADASEEERHRRGENAYREMMAPPWVVVVSQRLAEDPDTRREDYAAVACAIQNMLLAATAEGLGSYWGTGPLASSPQALEFLGLPDDHRIVGIIFIGYPAQVPKARRKPLSEVSRWLT